MKRTAIAAILSALTVGAGLCGWPSQALAAPHAVTSPAGTTTGLVVSFTPVFGAAPGAVSSGSPVLPPLTGRFVPSPTTPRYGRPGPAGDPAAGPDARDRLPGGARRALLHADAARHPRAKPGPQHDDRSLPGVERAAQIHGNCRSHPGWAPRPPSRHAPDTLPG